MLRKVISIVLCAFMFATVFGIEVMKDVDAQITEEWVRLYNGPGNYNDLVSAMAVDQFGNVYVTGASLGSGPTFDIATIKYDTFGNELWVARYDGPVNSSDCSYDIVVDSFGDIYITGYSVGIGGSADFITIKYEPNGNKIWEARYDCPSNQDDQARAMALDSSQNIYVTGVSSDGVAMADIATVKYDSNGNEVWATRYNSPQDGCDRPFSIALDTNGNTYVTGETSEVGKSFDYLTIKYDSNGTEEWVKRYNGPGSDADRANDISVGPSGNIYITGYSWGSGTTYNYTTIAYDPLGNELWVAIYNGPGNNNDLAWDLAIDSYENIYVTGESIGNGTSYDFTTIKYDSYGDELWVARYNSPFNSAEQAWALVLDSSGNIYVTGRGRDTVNSWDYLTVAYNNSGNELWAARYNGPGNGPDSGRDIVVDSSGAVYVTGFAQGVGTEFDYATVKYSQHSPNIPPIADAGSNQTVNEGDIVQFNGSGSYDSDGTIVTYEWDFDLSDGLWWVTGAPPDGIGPDPTHAYDDYGIFIATLRVTDNSGSIDTDSCELTVLVPPPLPPTLYINASLNGKDVILYWDPPLTPGIDHYLIYRSTSQTGFDFDIVWVNTSSDNESGEPVPIPLRTMWNDTKAALPGDPSYEEEYYYIVRAVNVVGEVSRTSRTAGKWTKTFPQGVSTFSIPLEPLGNFDTEWCTSSMNAEFIKYMNTTTHTWMQHNFGDGNSNSTQMKLGEGYEVKFSSETNYTFTGMSGAMIRYKTGGFTGFDYNTDARNLSATVDPITGNVTLNWTQPSSMDGDDSYKVYRSTTRDGFDNGTAVLLNTHPFGNETYVDSGAALLFDQCYYMVIPVNETNVEGSSTYSIGVWTEEYLSQYDSFGIPLKMSSTYTVDWYCDNIPDAVGINYFMYTQQRWSWHSTRMPNGAFDPMLVMTEGYQISTFGTTKFTFIGV